MRWQKLFADLEAQFVEATTAADLAESASRARSEAGAVLLAGRLAGSIGRPVLLRCRGAGPVSGVLDEVGPDWVLLSAEHGRELLVASAVITMVSGLVQRTAAPDGGIPPVRTDLRRALRGLARDRSEVSMVLDDGGRLTGTLDRVGADHVEVAEHPAGEPRRPGAVRAVHAVPLGAVALVARSAVA